MKTFDLSHDTLSGLSKRIMAINHKLEQRNPIHFHINLRVDAASLKPIKNYLAGAISEGLKQNLLGSDINMEFLILTVRSYSQLLADKVSKKINSRFTVTDHHELVS